MAFWDSSAIVPLCCYQPASARLRELQRQQPQVVVWWGTPVEVRSALNRLARAGAMTTSGSKEAGRRLNSLREVWKETVPTEHERDLAEAITESYDLRALDAFQLAAALMWCNEHPRGRPFICLDDRLARAAEQAGFQVLA